MPKFSKRVEIPGKSAQELYALVSSDIDRFMEKTPIRDYQIHREENEKTVSVKSKMFSANLLCAEGALELEVQLSLLAAPFKSKLEEGITRWVSKRFNL